MNFQPVCRFGGYMLKDSTGLAQTIQTYARTKQPHRVSTMHPSREPSCYHVLEMRGSTMHSNCSTKFRSETWFLGRQ
ncbi:hypothetical protein ACFX2I_013784 [Malus domestica]